jgi:predicted NAD-dependent protein-ADP-ribosyltransferase YbiA (DUF1768 family)
VNPFADESTTAALAIDAPNTAKINVALISALYTPIRVTPIKKLLAIATIAAPLLCAQYPTHWWKPVPEAGKPDWEILPQAAHRGEVILSKRNELGILSNFAATPFIYRGRQYASVEGFWQMMLYPEGPSDPRNQSGIVWPHTREQVAAMTAFDAKNAGAAAEENMRKLGIDWVTFEGQYLPYRAQGKGEHYRLIVGAMWAKLVQNPKVRQILLATGKLKLLPDHIQEPDAPPEWRYFDIWMEIRSELQQHATSSPARR